MCTLFFALGILAIALICGCTSHNESGGQAQNHSSQELAFAPYEVHEFGVIVGCDDGGYYLTNRPTKMLLVKQPVLYFHANKSIDVNVTVTFLRGSLGEVYPGKNSGNRVVWQAHVLPPAPMSGTGRNQPRKAFPLTFEDFEFVAPILNNTDANPLIVDGKEKTRFLYYEGQLPFRNPLRVRFEKNGDAGVFVVKNTGSYPVFGLFLAHAEKGKMMFNPEVYYGFALAVRPGEEVRIPADRDRMQHEKQLARILLSRGFTHSETDAFVRLWANTFFYRTNTAGWTNAAYLIPNRIYDMYVRESFQPKPKEVVRVIFVVAHVE